MEGIHVSQFSLEGGANKRGVHVGHFSIEGGAKRRWFMLLSCLLTGSSIFFAF